MSKCYDAGFLGTKIKIRLALRKVHPFGSSVDRASSVGRCSGEALGS